MERKGKRILIFNVNWLGDVLFSTAVIRNLRRAYPDGYIACVIPLRCQPILKDNPYLDEVIIFDEKASQRGLLDKMIFIKLLKLKKFDAAYLLHRSLSRALICRLAGIPERIGYDEKNRGFLLTKALQPPRKDSLHRIDYYLNVIKEAGVEISNRHLDLFFSSDDKKAADAFLRDHAVGKEDFLVALNPGGNWLPKRWPQEDWAELADVLIGEYGAKVIITGSANDLPLINEIKKRMKHKVIVAAGNLEVKQFAALCKRMDLFVCADTGPLHIANSIGTKKIIALFGPTSPKLTGPYPVMNVTVMQEDVGCKIPCYAVNCPDNRCMKALKVQAVLEQIKVFKS